MPGNEVGLDPQSIGNVTVRFTAPEFGDYVITGEFEGINTGEHTHTVAVLDDGTVVASGTISSFEQVVTFDLDNALNVGDTIDFVVDTGNNGDLFSLGTGLAATISTVASAVISNAGAMDVSGTTTISLEDIENAGAMTVENGATLILSGSVISGGTVQLDDIASVLVGNGTSAIDNAVINNSGTIEAESGTLTIAAGDAVTNAGTLEANGGVLEIAGAVTGPGTVTITASGTADFYDALDENVGFIGTGTLGLNDPAAYNTATISGLVDGDTIDLLDISSSLIASATIEGSTLVVAEFGGASFSFNIAGNLSGNQIAVDSDNSGGTNLVLGAAAPSGTSSSDHYVWGSSIAGSWDVAGNWDDTTAGLGPASVAPGVHDLVAIDAAGGGATHVITGTGASASLTIAGPTVLAGQFTTGSLGLNGNTVVNAGDSLSVSGNATGSSTLTVDGGGLTIGGNDSLGTLDISSGTVTTIGGNDSGSVNVSGASLAITGGLSGSVSVGADGTVTTGAGLSSGSVNVSGGSSLTIGGDFSSYNGSATVNAGSMSVEGGVENNGYGGALTLLVENGGTLTVTGNLADAASIFGSTSSAGTLSVTVLKSSLTNSTVAIDGDIDLGANPFQFIGPGAGSPDSFDVNGGTLTAAGIAATGSGAEFTIHNGGTLAITGNVTDDGSSYQVNDGTFTIGGTLTANDTSIGISNAGTATVGGAMSASGGSVSVADSNFTVDGTLTTSGTSITASSGGSIHLAGLSGSDSLSVDGTSSLEVGTAGGAATGSITIDSGLTVDQSGSLAAPKIVVDGTLVATGNLTLNGSPGGDGQIEIAGGANLTLEGAVPAANATDTISFTGTGSVLTVEPSALNAAKDLTTTIAGFNASDAIDFGGTVTSASFTNGVLALLDGNATVADLDLSGNYSGQAFISLPLSSSLTQINVIGAGDTGTAPSGTSSSDHYVWGSSIAGSWDVAGNWDDTTAGLGPASVAPGVHDLVAIDAAGGGATHVITGTGASASLTIAGPTVLAGQFTTGSLGLNGNTVVNAGDSLSVSGNATGSSTLTVDGGGLTIGGNDSLGTLDISSGTVTTIGGNDSGSVNVSGASLAITGGLSGSVSVGADGTVTTGAGLSSGSVNVSGGSSLTIGGDFSSYNGSATVNAGSMSVEGGVENNGYGGALTLLVENGGTLTVTGNLADAASIFGSTSSAGTLSVTVLKSSLTNSTVAIDGDIDLGANPFQFIGPGAGSPDSFDVNGGTLTAAGIAATGSGAEFTIHNGGTLAITGNVTDDGSSYQVNDGTFTIGGTLTANDTSIGISNAGTATVGGAMSASGGSVSVADSNFTVDGTLTTSGTSITASSGGSIHLAGLSGSDSLSVDGTSSLEVGTAGGAATGSITIDSGLTVDQSGSLAAPKIVVDGTLVATGNLTLNGSPGGDGQIEIAGGANLTLEGAVPAANATDTISFTGTTVGSVLTIEPSALNAAHDFTPIIIGLNASDAIDFGGTVTSASFTNGVLALLDGNTTVAEFELQGNYANASFNIEGIGSGLTQITPIGAINGLPVLTVPGAQTLVPGEAAAISGVSVSETENTSGEIFTVVLGDTHGDLSANTSAAGGGGTISGSAGTSLTISGTLSQVNADLTTLSDIDDTVAVGSAEIITVNATDSFGDSANQRTVAVTVNAPAVVTDSWLTGTAGDWSTASDWVSGVVPTLITDAIINDSNAVTLDGAAIANSLTLDNSNLSVGGMLTLSGTLTIDSGAIEIAIGATFTGASNLVLSGGTLDAGTAALTVGSYEQSGGTLSGTGTLTVTGAASFSGGVGGETGSGETVLHGASSIEQTISLDGGRELQNQATLTWSNGNIYLGYSFNAPIVGGGTLDNALGATFQIESDVGVFVGNGITLFSNEGLLTKSVTTGTTTIDATFDNTGTVNVETGTLDLAAGGTDVGATYEGAGTIEFGAGTRTLDGTSSISQTNVIFSGGTTTLDGSTYDALSTTVSGGTADLSAAMLTSLGDDLNISGGTLDAGTAALTVGSYEQSGGTLSGTGTLTVTGAASFSGGVGGETGSGETVLHGASSIEQTISLDGGRELQNQATLTWSNGNIYLGYSFNAPIVGGGTLDNALGATFQIESDVGVFVGNGITLFSNEGLLTKSVTTGTTTIDATFDNTGTVNVETGTLDLAAGGTDVGATYEGAGTIEFGAGTRTLDGTSSISQTNVIFSGGTTTLDGSTYDALSTTVSGGTADLSAAMLTSLGDDLNISGGTLDAGTAALTVGSYEQSGGTLSGTGTLTVTGAASFSGGVGGETGSGETVLHGASSIEQTISLDGGRELQNQATLTWSNGNIYLGYSFNAPIVGGGTLDNALGATFQIESDVGVFVGNGITLFSNEGLLTKSVTTGTTTIDATFDNTGTVNVETGTLDLAAGGTDVGATYEGAGTIEFGAGTRTLDDVTLSGQTTTLTCENSGTLDFVTAASAVNFADLANESNSDSLQIENVRVTFDGTTVNGGAVTETGAGAQINVDAGHVTTFENTTLTLSNTASASGAVLVSGTLDVASSVTIAGAGTVTIAAGGTADFNDAFEQNVAFTGVGTLGLDEPAAYSAATISGLVDGDTIDLLDISSSLIASATIEGSKLIVDEFGGASFGFNITGNSAAIRLRSIPITMAVRTWCLGPRLPPAPRHPISMYGGVR